jgi:hypothetical protein
MEKAIEVAKELFKFENIKDVAKVDALKEAFVHLITMNLLSVMYVCNVCTVCMYRMYVFALFWVLKVLL